MLGCARLPSSGKAGEASIHLIFSAPQKCSSKDERQYNATGMVQSSVISGVILKNTSNERYATFILIENGMPGKTSSIRSCPHIILLYKTTRYSMYNLQEGPGFRSFPGQAAAMRHLKTTGWIRRAVQVESRPPIRQFLTPFFPLHAGRLWNPGQSNDA